MLSEDNRIIVVHCRSISEAEQVDAGIELNLDEAYDIYEDQLAIVTSNDRNEWGYASVGWFESSEPKPNLFKVISFREYMNIKKPTNRIVDEIKQKYSLEVL